MEEESRRVYTPADVASRIGISVTGVRRLANQYERVHGELPRDDRGRVWPEEAVERLERARRMVRGKRATSVEAALRGAVFEDVGGEPVPAVDEDLPHPQEALLRELRAIRELLETQDRRLASLEEENRALRLRLEPPAEKPSEPPESPEAASEREGGGPAASPTAEEGIEVSTPQPEEGAIPPKDPPRTPWWRRLFKV